MTKKELRAYYKEKRLSLQQKHEKDFAILNNLKASKLYKNCSQLFLYISSETEVDTRTLIDFAVKDGKTVAAPKCNTENCTMQFYQISSSDDLEKGAYGIAEPKEFCVPAVSDEKTVCIVPGLSFSKDGNRLGYGKGYYDRFLEKFIGKSVGLCYNEFLADSLITDEHDQKVSVIVTEKENYYIR